MSRSYGPEEQRKLESLINQGVQTLYEVESLKLGLKDAVEAISDELDIKPALINKAINIAHKGNWQDTKSNFEELEAILDISKQI